jgi:hypothetical protein
MVRNGEYGVRKRNTHHARLIHQNKEEYKESLKTLTNPLFCGKIRSNLNSLTFMFRRPRMASRPSASTDSSSAPRMASLGSGPWARRLQLLVAAITLAGCTPESVSPGPSALEGDSGLCEINYVAPEGDESSLKQGIEPEKIMRTLSYRLHKREAHSSLIGDESSPFFFYEGGLEAKLTEEGIQQMIAMHENLREAALTVSEVQEPGVMARLSGDGEEWEALELQRVAENSYRSVLSTMEDCHDVSLGLPEGSEDLLGIAATKLVLDNPGSVMEASPTIGELAMHQISTPFSLEGGEGMEYIGFPRLIDDDIGVIIDHLFNSEARRDKTKWMLLIELYSTSEEWNIPRSLIDSEKVKDDLLWIDFKQFEMASYPEGISIGQSRRRLNNDDNKQPVLEDHAYHNGFPVLTDDNRQFLIEKYPENWVQICNEGIVFCDDIYTKDEENTEWAGYVSTEVATLMTDRGGYITEKFQVNHGLPEYYKVIPYALAAGRTIQYQELLGGSNGNATDVSDMRVSEEGVVMELWADGVKVAERDDSGELMPIKVKMKKGLPKRIHPSVKRLMDEHGHVVPRVTMHATGHAVDSSKDTWALLDTRTGALIWFNSGHHPNFVAGIRAYDTDFIEAAQEAGTAKIRVEVNGGNHIVATPTL